MDESRAVSTGGELVLHAGRNARKFVCEGCGDTIISVGADLGGNICFMCHWLRGLRLTDELRGRLRAAHGFAKTRVEERRH